MDEREQDEEKEIRCVPIPRKVSIHYKYVHTNKKWEKLEDLSSKSNMWIIGNTKGRKTFNW